LYAQRPMKIHNCSCGVTAWEFGLSHLPKWGSSKYSVTIRCMYITTRGAYILFQKKHLYGSRFTNGYENYTLQMSSHTQYSSGIWNIFCELWCVQNPQVTCGCGVTLTLSANMIIGSALSGWVRQVHCSGSLTGWLIKDISNFLETVLLGLIEDFPLSQGRTCGFSSVELHQILRKIFGRSWKRHILL
jgi:hypothetical protein